MSRVGAVWDIPIGTMVWRRELHERFGGSERGGIATCAGNPNILLFSRPSGRLYGYEDGWRDDGAFHRATVTQAEASTVTRGSPQATRRYAITAGADVPCDCSRAKTESRSVTWASSP